MANLVYSFKERAADLRLIAGILQSAIAKNNAAERYRDSLFNKTINKVFTGAGSISEQMGEELAALENMLTTAKNQLNDIITHQLVYEETVRPYVAPANFTAWTITYNNAGSGKSKIAANNTGKVPFGEYLAGDVITVSNCEVPTWDGEYTVDSVDASGEYIILTALLGSYYNTIHGSGAATSPSSLTDEQATIRIVRR